MEFKDESTVEEWKQYTAKCGDAYSMATVNYAVAWADMMEARMKDGKPLAEVAKQASHDADTEGITGFMYGHAARMLVAYWKHGEELRLWFNVDCAPEQGAAVNAMPGKVINPAVLTLVTKED